jgi:hypothetical protein
MAEVKCSQDGVAEVAAVQVERVRVELETRVATEESVFKVLFLELPPIMPAVVEGVLAMVILLALVELVVVAVAQVQIMLQDHQGLPIQVVVAVVGVTVPVRAVRAAPAL